ncbi:T9SS type A sorting domain-containing protein [Gracilimonas sp. BCB1]|uniref:T9SS type A sorting domain-containing protein n=1 Tax=Gracilimonas sp. BCB1 TaxID=3152362 RepID=UPI003F825689
MLSQNGATGKDPQDALRLLPFSDSHIEFYSTLDDGTELVINNRSSNFIHRQNIPLHFQAYLGGQVAAGSYTLRWPGLRNVPEEWMVILFDYETGQEINLREQQEYVFTYNSKKKLKQAQPTSGSPSMNKNKSSSRFMLRITTEEIEANIPEEVYLYQNYPNPFNPTTTIPFGLTEETDVRLEVFDILGRKVQTLVSEKLPAGTYNIPFRAGSLASGVYLYRVITNQKVMTNKMVLIK